jgi:glycosyltransferase involved in cell wall biosynthesis
MRSQPLVTFGMPLRNEERHLKSALDSILAQDHANIEVLISDNCSTDNTGEIAREYARKDRRVRYVPQAEPVAALDNFWVPLKLAQGEYFAWAAGHDLWHPSFASANLQALLADANAGLCYGRTALIAEDGHVVNPDYSEGIDTRRLGVVSRFNCAIWRPTYCSAIYGLWARSHLMRAHKPIRQYGWDKVVLAEMSCYSVFVELPQVLFSMRIDKLGESPRQKYDRLVAGTRDQRAVRRVRPQSDKAIGYLKMLADLDIAPKRKALLVPSLALCLSVRYGREIVHELSGL